MGREARAREQAEKERAEKIARGELVGDPPPRRARPARPRLRHMEEARARLRDALRAYTR